MLDQFQPSCPHCQSPSTIANNQAPQAAEFMCRCVPMCQEWQPLVLRCSAAARHLTRWHAQVSLSQPDFWAAVDSTGHASREEAWLGGLAEVGPVGPKMKLQYNT